MAVPHSERAGRRAVGYVVPRRTGTPDVPARGCEGTGYRSLGAPSRGAIGALERYRCGLDALDHPHIARVIDAGVTEEERAYLVTEHLVGPPLGKFCERSLLNASDRLRVLQMVCDTIDHAHARDVAHGPRPTCSLLRVKPARGGWCSTSV